MGLTRRDFPLPQMVRANLHRLEAADIAPTRPASTVMLLRDAADRPGARTGAGGQGVEVFVMRRVATMAFAADVTVFPGGGVDPRDDDPGLPWRGPGADEWAQLLGVAEGLARGLLAAAAREVFEECGVLLAARHDGAGTPDLRSGPWPRLRDALARREVSFGDVLEDHGLEVRTDLVRAVARWVTPEFEPRRFDTFFFVARAPSGQEPDGRTSEAKTAGWARPRDLLAGAASGEIKLLPPTQVQLEVLAQAPDVTSALAREIEPTPLARIMPTPTRRDGELILRCEVPS